MQRIAVAVVLSGLLAACGQQSPAAGETGAAPAALDYIDAVPITEEDTPPPVAQPRPAAKKEEPKEEPATGDKAPEVETRTVPPPAAEPAAKADDAPSATRRANEATATPAVVAATETPARSN